MSTEKKKEQQLLEDVTAQPAVQPSYSTAGLNSSKEVENALANAEYAPGQSVTNAAADLKNWQQNRPGKYESTYQGRIEDLIGQLLERNSFQYSYAQDPLYRQYAQQYTQNARNASADAAAQAAALTGGYGSSYAQSAAQQSYQRYLQQLSDVLPQLQSAAYSRYRDEGDALLDRYKLLQGQDEEAYGRWQDLVSAWQKEVSQAQSRYDQISSRDLKNYQLLLDYFADKAAAEQKGLHTSKTDESALSSIGNTASLSSTAAESLERAMNNYLKSGNAQQADTLLNQYKNRMTPAQKARFEALFAAWNRPLSW